MATAFELFTKTTIKALEAALTEANGRATARTLSLDECVEYIDRFVCRCGITKKAMTGTEITVHGSMEKLPRAYKYQADSTKAAFEFNGKHWEFVEAVRSTLTQRSSYCHVQAAFSETARDALAAKYEEC